MQTTVLQRVRRIDPATDTDDVVDVLIAAGRVARIGEPGDSSQWAETATAHVIAQPDDAELVLCPGLVDVHTHVFGSAGVADIDAIGVGAGVPTIVDAGGAGAATIDDFVEHRLARVDTRVLSFMSIEAAGITDTTTAHNTTRTTAEMQTASLDDFLGATERHSSRVVGLKLWATVSAGLGWIDHATNLSELIDRPLLVHIGELDSALDQAPITGDALDRLQGGDMVTHCFTALPGGLIDEKRTIRPEVYAARDRGVLFDAAPGLENLSFERATAAMEQGWLPDSISTDVHRWASDRPSVATLPRVMTSFLALGLSLRATIERSSVSPAAAIGATTGRPLVGERATLSLLSLRKAAVICSDGTESIRGDETLDPVGCFIDGDWFPATTEHRRSDSVEDDLTPDTMKFLRRLGDQLENHRAHDSRWRGAELHRLVHRARVETGVSICEGLDALYGGLSVEPTLAAGWLLEGMGPEDSIERLRLAANR